MLVNAGVSGTYPPIDNPCFVEPEIGYYIQSGRDFRVDASGSVCLRLQDRNDNMMDSAVAMHLPIKGPAAATTVEGTDECVKSEEPPPCDMRAFSRDVRSGDDTSDPIELDEEGCKATVTGTGKVLDFAEMGMSQCPEFFESVSSSGRYIGVSHLTDSGDYVYRKLMFIDLSTGAYLAELDREIVGETSVMWSTAHDVLVVDGELLLFDPAPKVIDLGGTVSWLE